MSKDKKSVTAATPEKLRNPMEESRRASVIQSWAGTANLIRDCIQELIWDWHVEGGKIVTGSRQPQELCLERMETLGEAHVYDVDGQKISLHCANEAPLYLVRVDDCFRRNTRRTINRHFEKINNPSNRAVDRRLRSLMFWEDVAIKIAERRLDA